MSVAHVYQCECPNCCHPFDHPDKTLHHQINLLMGRLDEQQRRWYAAVEASRHGQHGVRLLSQITGLDEKTIRRGRYELEQGLEGRPPDRVRLPGAGRPSVERTHPEAETKLMAFIDNDIAGNPMNDQRWLRRSLAKLKTGLLDKGISFCGETIRRLLDKHDIRLKSNVKRLTPKAHSDRDVQFQYIQRQRQAFEIAGWPCISVDTKKKELIGPFYHSGRVWCQQAPQVYMHDFPNDAIGRSVPYGIYDTHNNLGSVYVGKSADTPEFAVDAIAHWWQHEGRYRFPNAPELLILADGGGSNGYRPRAWKQQLQVKLVDALGLTVTVCHYPPGASKWNPVEHRLFSEISKTWAGTPLTSFELMLDGIRKTTTTSGLKVQATLVENEYAKGIKVDEDEMKTLAIEKHATCPEWNYTIRPRNTGSYF